MTGPFRLFPPLAMVAAVLTLTGCVGSAPLPEISTGTTVVDLTVAGEDRSYVVTRPAELEQPVPLVIVLHGGFGDADYARDNYGWDELAEREGFVVAYPNGIARAWAAGNGCCGRPGASGTDDVAFLTAVVDDISARVGIDESRVFATGMSNGGMMAYRLACETGRFAGIAPVAATILGECENPGPISVLHIHGGADKSVRPDGEAGSGVENIDGWPIAEVNELWRTTAGCDPPVVTVDGFVRTSTAECPNGRVVELLTVAGAGHQWPGSVYTPLQERLGVDPPSTALDATATIWEFFESLHKR